MKICSTCKEEKDRAEFHRNRTTHDGRFGQCKACRKKRAVIYYNENKEKMKARDRQYRLEKEYGISLEHYNEMYAQQGGVCSICGCSPKTKRNHNHPSLAVDHNHKTGEVRGLLCISCNFAIGLLKDDEELLMNAINYLNGDHL